MLLKIEEPGCALDVGQRLWQRVLQPLEYLATRQGELELADELLQVILDYTIQVDEFPIDVIDDFHLGWWAQEIQRGAASEHLDIAGVRRASVSREFSNWQSMHTKPMEQEQFAIYLEDNIADIVEPSGETLLQVALTLQTKTAVDFSSSKRLDNGQVQLTYTEIIDS